jgi:thiamine kinase-like enzyme
MELKHDLEPIIASFLPNLTSFEIVPIQEGLINATFEIKCFDNQLVSTFILQKINTTVFENPDCIQQNIFLVNEHLKAVNYPFDTIELVKNKDGNFTFFYKKEAWRMMQAIRNSYTIAVVQNTKQAFEIAAFFGKFHKALSGINATILKSVLPDFLNVENRVVAFHLALQQASKLRIEIAKNEIEWLLENQNIPVEWIDLQRNNKLPMRIIHADPKISNVLFDSETHLPKAIIDWDTLMNGTILYDFADMIRSYTNTKKEDDPDSENVFNSEIYLAITEGFLNETKSFLSDIELKNLHYAPKVIVYIQAMRFLTDFLNNDVYYQCSFEKQNLFRTINQMNLLKEIIIADFKS